MSGEVPVIFKTSLSIFLNSLNENKLQVDERKREKSLEEIKKLDKVFLGQFVRKYFSFKSEIEEIESRIKATNVPEKFRNFNKQLEDINLRIEKNNAEFEKLGNDVIKLNENIADLKNEVVNSVKEIFGEEIVVVV